MATHTRTIGTEAQRSDWLEMFQKKALPFSATISTDAPRSLSQNALLHKWFGEIAKHRGDCTLQDVKGECHRKYGLPIKLTDPKWEWVWERSGARMGYEKQCSLLGSGVMSVSSSMTTAQLKKYMDAMQRDFLAEAVRLTDPEER